MLSKKNIPNNITYKFETDWRGTVSNYGRLIKLTLAACFISVTWSIDDFKTCNRFDHFFNSNVIVLSVSFNGAIEGECR